MKKRKTRYVFAVDPGGTTGWVLYDTKTGDLNAGQTRGREKFLELASATLAEDVEVVYEEYRITQRTVSLSRQPDAMFIIGALMWMCQKTRLPIVSQTPAEAKRLVTDDVLADLGWRQPSSKDHANDALRHLVLRLVRRGDIDPRRLLNGDG